MDDPLAIDTVHLSLRSFDHPDLDSLLSECVVGQTLCQFKDFDRKHSFALLVTAKTQGDDQCILHRSCAYRFDGFAVQADAWSHDYARHAGFHLPGLATRVVYCSHVDGLPPEKIL